jgi:hypothetical protein
MAMFKVRRRVDAYVDYVAKVEAGSPKEAAELASDDETAFTWEEEGPCEFDARIFITLDADGSEIDGTECGDL